MLLFLRSYLYWLNVIIAIAATQPGNHNDSSSCSSGPESPNVQDHSGRTQYVSATCVVVTHYSGDVASVVDEHFTRALNFNDKNSKGTFNVYSLLLTCIEMLRNVVETLITNFWAQRFVPIELSAFLWRSLVTIATINCNQCIDLIMRCKVACSRHNLKAPFFCPYTVL